MRPGAPSEPKTRVVESEPLPVLDGSLRREWGPLDQSRSEKEVGSTGDGSSGPNSHETILERAELTRMRHLSLDGKSAALRITAGKKHAMSIALP
jgi:hypothetical protein